MRIQIIGGGRMGTALERALRDVGAEVLPTIGRAEVEAARRESAIGDSSVGADADVVLLAVPDAAIAEVSAVVAPGRLVGHLSGITPLTTLSPHESFGLHPLLTVTGAGDSFAGSSAAVDGTSLRALAVARELAGKLGMGTFRVADEDRAAYHAAASIAANFLVVLEGAAEGLAATAGVPRDALVPLAEAALRNWAELGPAAALTGPIARGDEETSALQRLAVADRTPETLGMFDTLAAAARKLTRASIAEGQQGPGAPRVVRTVRELREALGTSRGAHGTGLVPSVGLVPTMGALHEGHLSLVRAARAAHEIVVLSIFVNPTQFTEAADLAAYPRQEAADLALAAGAGVDIVFAPEASALYPEGFATTVRVAGPLTAALEGAGRGSEHFDGVATVVSKLLIAVRPDAAYFGQKDAQQLLVVRRMVADLGIQSRIVACPTLRDADGLALSSRNARLNVDERRRAAAIPRALEAVTRGVSSGETDVAVLRAEAEGVLRASRIDVEYLAFVDPATLAPVTRIDGDVLCAVAAQVGDVRLIDNAVLRAESYHPREYPIHTAQPDPHEER